MPHKLKSEERAWRRSWRLKNKKRICKHAKVYYSKNKKRICNRAKAWRKENPKRYQAQMRRWRKKNAGRVTFLCSRWQKRNRKRYNAANRNWYRKNLTKARSSRLKCSYGITLKDFLLLQKKQKNKCGICQKRFDKTPHVDHNHQTGVIRGLLCGHCNRGLGMFRDSLKTLKLAMKYLKCSIIGGGAA